ncbi:MAG: FIST C-terminal domain-containing protein [Candidatus Latescibacteria bacterium]|nr:FIST C-terminal domain-containing protein [Candidatus Latescibacterota bacterium]
MAEKSLKNGGIEKPDFLLTFCCNALDYEKYFRGIQSIIGKDVPIIGGSAIGIITNDVISYEGFSAGALIIESSRHRHHIAIAKGLNSSEKNAALKIADALPRSNDDRLLTILYDSIKKPGTSNSPPIINASSGLISGIESKFGTDVPIIGAGLLGDNTFNHTKQFCGSHVDNQSIIALLLSGDFKAYSIIMHGCTPLDGIYHKITKIDGDIIYEIDNKPIVKMIDEIYGHKEWRRERPVLLISIGVNCGERYDEPVEAHYINRLIMGILPEGNGVRIFEPDLEEGSEIQFMLRDTGEIVDSAKRNSQSLMQQIQSDGHMAVLGLYIDCGGRASAISNTAVEEASEVQNVCNKFGIPLFGFYSGVEIAPLLGKSRGLDLTGVLTVLTDG